MLAEFWLWLRARCTPSARQLGHLTEAIALSARSKRQQLPWRAHQQHTRDAILRVAAQCPSARCAVILGSGDCHDIPLAELAAQFEQVLLMDIVHLPGIRQRIAAFSNVQLQEYDLTGVVAALADRNGQFSDAELDALELPKIPILQRNDVDFVASVNLLSQLPVKPIEYLQQHSPNLSLDALNAFAWRLLRHHIAQLRLLKIPVCVVSDDVQRTWNQHDELIEQITLITELGLTSKVFERWQWPIAPRGELPDGQRAEHEVVAIQL